MQNHERKSGKGKAAVAVGLALLSAVASAGIRHINGLSLVRNRPPYEDTHVAEIVRYPKQGVLDSLEKSIGPTSGLYDVDCRFMSPPIQLGETLMIRTLDKDHPEECASIIVPVDSSLLINDTLPRILYVRSMNVQDTTRSNKVFTVDMLSIKDTSGTTDPVKYACFTADSDTIIDSVYSGAGFDRVRAQPGRLNKPILNGTPINLVFFKGVLSDTTSRYTRVVVNALRDIGSFIGLNDAMRIPDRVFPETVLGVQEYKPSQVQVPKHKSPQSPCGPASLERYVQENSGNVEVFDAAGKRVQVGGYSNFAEGAYFLRTMYRLGHAKHQEAVDTDKVVVKK